MEINRNYMKIIMHKLIDDIAAKELEYGLNGVKVQIFLGWDEAEVLFDALDDTKQNFIEKDVLDNIRAEILDEAEYAYADFDRYKEDVLYAEPDELPDDNFRYGMERAVEIINKYKIERKE